MVVEGEVRRVRAGDSVSVAPGQRYDCRAETELRVIEVQVGGSVACFCQPIVPSSRKPCNVSKSVLLLATLPNERRGTGVYVEVGWFTL